MFCCEFSRRICLFLDNASASLHILGDLNITKQYHVDYSCFLYHNIFVLILITKIFKQLKILFGALTVKSQNFGHKSKRSKMSIQQE